MITKEEFFLVLLNKMYVSKDKKYPGYIIFKEKNGDLLMCYDKKNDTLWIDYDCIWSVFESIYKMEYKNIQQFIIYLLWNHLKWKIRTTRSSRGKWSLPLWNHLKWKSK